MQSKTKMFDAKLRFAFLSSFSKANAEPKRSEAKKEYENKRMLRVKRNSKEILEPNFWLHDTKLRFVLLVSPAGPKISKIRNAKEVTSLSCTKKEIGDINEQHDSV